MRAKWQHVIQLTILALLWFGLLAGVITCAGQGISDLLAPK